MGTRSSDYQHLSIKDIIKFAKGFCKEKESELEIRGKGRKPTYPLWLILTLSFLKERDNLSYRKVEEVVKEILRWYDIPDFSTLFYRLSRIPDKILDEFLDYVSMKGLRIELPNDNKGENKRQIILVGDGTNFKFMKRIKFKSGREVSFHIRCFVLGAILPDNRVQIIGVEVGKGYSYEVALAKNLFNRIDDNYLEGKIFTADRLYGNDLGFMEFLESKGMIVVCRIDTNLGERFERERKRFRDNYELYIDIYVLRKLIEGVFGSIKKQIPNAINAYREDMARKLVKIRFIIWAMKKTIEFRV